MGLIRKRYKNKNDHTIVYTVQNETRTHVKLQPNDGSAEIVVPKSSLATRYNKV